MRVIIYFQQSLQKKHRNWQCYTVSMTTPKFSKSTNTIHSKTYPAYIRDLGDGFYIECFKSMKYFYHHLFASICCPYHLFYTVRFAMCILTLHWPHCAAQKESNSSQGYEIWYSRDISFTFVAIGQYMDLHLNIVHTREIWNRFIDFFYCYMMVYGEHFSAIFSFLYFSFRVKVNIVPILGLHIYI